MLRNKEIKRFLLAYLVISAGIAAAAFAVNIFAGVFTVVSCAVFVSIFMLFNRARYRQIAALSDQLDRILHGGDVLDIGGFEEGELSILQSELQKLTVRLREQAYNLSMEKTRLSDSLADIAHQIRTPLTSINILAALLSKDEPGKRAERIRELETLLSRIDWLIAALLKISKIDAGTVAFTKTETPVGVLIKKSLEPFAIPLELRDIKIEESTSGNIRCDLAWTAEALGNIIKNCIEYMETGGIIKIEAGQNPVCTQIVIADNGSGISDTDLPHLFERFYKGENPGKTGYGIGLALCRMIISRQNGTVKAERNQPRGARFIIKFYHDQTI